MSDPLDGSTAGDRRPATTDRLREWMTNHFGIDPRGLAAFRIAVGTLLFADLLLRARNLTAFYTDAGVLPRAALAEQYPAFAKVSLHALSGSAWWQALLFALAGIAAVALAVGYRTRVATVASFLLLASLQARNPLVLNGGDALLVRLLLWSALLPLDRRWSVDALRRRSPGDGTEAADATSSGDRIATVATAGLLVQVVVVYVANLAFKLRGDLWVEGVAIRYVFSLDQFTWLAGEYLAAVPALLVALDRAWLALLFASPLLVLTAGWRRTALAAAFVGAHLGMLVTLRLGLFPLVSVAALVPFFGPATWNRIEDRVRPRMVDGARRLASRWGGSASKLDRSPSSPNPGAEAGSASTAVDGGETDGDGAGRSPGEHLRERGPAVIAAVLLVGVVVWNAATLGVVALPQEVTDAVDPDERRWDMFAPEPLTSDAWFVAPARLASGGRVDAFHGGPVRWDRPPEVSATYPTERWRKFLGNVRAPDGTPYRDDLARYLCRRWNRTNADGVRSLRVVVLEQPTRLDGPEPIRRRTLARRDCRTI